jgi:hypothetical protein
MPRRFSGDQVTDLITETGEAISDDDGAGYVLLLGSHYSVVTVIVSSLESSVNSFVLSANSAGFAFGTSSPNSKITYKAISTRA